MKREHLYRLGDRAGQWLWKRWTARRIFAWLSIVVLLRLGTLTPALADVDVIGIVEATQQCQADEVAELNPGIVVVNQDGRIEIVGVPQWRCVERRSV